MTRWKEGDSVRMYRNNSKRGVFLGKGGEEGRGGKGGEGEGEEEGQVPSLPGTFTPVLEYRDGGSSGGGLTHIITSWQISSHNFSA